MHVCMYVCIYIYVYIHIYIYIHIYTRTHTHTVIERGEPSTNQPTSVQRKTFLWANHRLTHFLVGGLNPSEKY